MTDEFSYGLGALESHSTSLGNRLAGTFQNFADFIMPHKAVAKTLHSLPFTPFQDKTFYYDYFKGEKEDVFETHLKQLGWTDNKVKKWVANLSQLPPEAAYKKVSEIAPEFADFLRDTYFTKPARWKYRQMGAATYAGINVAYNAALKPLPDQIEAAVRKSMGQASYDKLLRDLETTIHLDYNANPAVAVFKGFAQSLPIVNKVLKFDGAFLDKERETTGYQMLNGLGYVTGMIAQLLLLHKFTAPVVYPVSAAMQKWTIGHLGIDTSQKASRLMRAGTTMVNTIFGKPGRIWPSGAISGAFNYGAMRAMNIGLGNIVEGKEWEIKDTEDVLKGIEIGAAMAGISSYFRLSPTFNPIWARPVEELAQVAAAGIFGLSETYQEKGSLTGQDFWDTFAWEMFEVAPENLVPILFGLLSGNPLLSTLDIEGYAARAADYAIQGKMEVLSHGLGLTGKAALEAAVSDITTDIRLIEEGGDRVGPRQMSTLLKNYRNQQLKVFSEPGYYDVPVRNPRARELLWHYYIQEGYTLNKDGTMKRLDTIEFVKEMTQKKILDIQEKRFSDENYMNNIYKTIEQELAVGEPYIGKFASGKYVHVIGPGGKSTRMKKIDALRYRILTKTILPKDFAKDYSDNIDWKTFEKWEHSKVTNTEEAAFKQQATLDGKIIILDSEGNPTGTMEGARFVDKMLENWIIEHWGYKFDAKYLYDDEVDLLLHELDMWEEINTEWGAARIRDLIAPEKHVKDHISKMQSNWSDYWHSNVKFLIEHNLWEPLMAVRKGQGEMRTAKADILEDFRRPLYEFLPRTLRTERPFRILTHLLSTGVTGKEGVAKFQDYGYKVDSKQLSKAIGELRAYLPSRTESPYFKAGQKRWNIKSGLRLYFDIPRGLSIKNYFPFMSRIASLLSSNNPKDHEKAVRYINNPNEMPRSDLRTPPLKNWIEDPNTGYRGVELYINRGLKTRFMKGPVERFIEMSNLQKLPTSAHNVITRWVASLKGVPLNEDAAVFNWLTGKMKKLNKLPIVGKKISKLDNLALKRAWNTAMSCIYAGGLGAKFSAAMKNAFQGPMNNPPGMTLRWWMHGLREVLTNAEARKQLEKSGIWHSFAVPVLNEELETRVARGLRATLKLFVTVDHWFNRGPIYMGARAQTDYYINKFKGIESSSAVEKAATAIGTHQWKEVAQRWQALGKEADAAYRKYEMTGHPEYKELGDARVETMKDEYGFLQQANSNWEYGILGRPHIFGTATAKLGGTFLTWPVWYWGTYMPSLWKHDKLGMLRHVAKAGLLIMFFRRYFSMNLKPWLLTGTLPMRPYGPIPQSIFYALEWLKAAEYSHGEWKQEALQNFLKSTKVFVPMYYGISDMVKVLDEMKRDLPYFDDRTGILHYERNWKKIGSDFLGVTSFYSDRDEMLKLMQRGEYEAAEAIGRRYGMKKIYRSIHGMKTGGK